jgi:hypothetical protein
MMLYTCQRCGRVEVTGRAMKQHVLDAHGSHQMTRYTMIRAELDAYEAVRKGDVWSTAAGVRIRCEGHEFQNGHYWLRVSRWDGAVWVADPMLYEDEAAVNAVGFDKVG